jgi:hypothetical protein
LGFPSDKRKEEEEKRGAAKKKEETLIFFPTLEIIFSSFLFLSF